MSEKASRRSGATACVLVALATGACGDGTRPPDAEPSIGMLDPSKLDPELTYAEWAVRYMKWQFEAPFSALLEVKDCTVWQDADHDGEVDGPVVFLDSDLAGRAEPKACAFGSEKAILFPLLPLTSLAPYYTDATMAAAKPGVDAAAVTSDALRDSVADFMRNLDIDEASIRVDGVEVQEPLSGSIAPIEYSYKPYPGDNLLFAYYGVADADIPETVAPAFVAGYWLLLAPLGRGQHEISVFVRGRAGVANVQVIHDQYTYQLMLD